MAAPSGHPYNKSVLGIDIGTTTVKVALLDEETQQVKRTLSRETHASMHSELGSLGNEQEAQKILTAVQFCVSGLPKEDLVNVTRIGISGQMHGVILWKKGAGWKRNNFGRFELAEASQLYTWQDGRCTEDFLSSLPKPESHLHLASGHGCCTLHWLQQKQPEHISKFDCAATIQDFVVAMLCGLESPVMSVQNAASWGYFNTVNKSWNKELLAEINFPEHLLPSVQEAGALAGSLQEVWYNMSKGTPVGVAMGDLQCSIISRLNPGDAVLNISTSAQLAFQMPENFIPDLKCSQNSSPIEYFPYFEGRYLAVAASLSGGNILANFVRTLQQWTHELGVGVPDDKIWQRLHTLASENNDTDLTIRPTMFGERHAPSERASVTNITPLNTTLGSVFCALCKGLINNLHSMMPQEVLRSNGVQRIMGSGTGLERNKLLQQEIDKQFQLPLVLCEDSKEDAAVGAAKAIMKYSVGIN